MEIEPLFDLNAALERVDGERDFLAELAGLFLGHLPRRMASLEKAVERQNAKAVGEAAHVIKGAASNLGARSTCDAASRLERASRDGAVERISVEYQFLVREVHRLNNALKYEFGI